MMDRRELSLAPAREPYGAAPTEADARIEAATTEDLGRLGEFAEGLASGDLRQELHVRGALADSLVSLQGSLRHLTWQARQLSLGDLSQRAHFLGELSGAFNSIAERLDEALSGVVRDDTQLLIASLAVSHSSLAMTIFDSRGAYVQVNAQACELLGYSAEEFSAMHVWDAAPEYSAELFPRYWQNFYEAGELETETQLRHKDGHLIPAGVSVARFAADGADMAVAFFSDLTARKRAEEALLESERKFARAFEDSPTSMSIMTGDGRYLDVNRAWENHTGFSRAEVLGRRVLEVGLWHADVIEQTMRTLHEQGRLSGYEVVFVTKTGLDRIGLLSAELIDVGEQPCVLYTIEDITERKTAETQTVDALRRLERLTEQTIATMGRLIEARDPYTAGHQRRVMQLSVAICRRLGLSDEARTGLSVAAQLHDIGKIVVPAEILSKPGHLDDAEFSLVKTHAQSGHDILAGVEFPWPVAEIVLEHHERLDGSGYPRGLLGEQIMLEAKILAVADVVEAMSAHRPYRPSLGIAAALEEIDLGRGRLYDSAVVDACLAVFRDDEFAFAE